MFKRLFRGLRTLPTRLLLFVVLLGCLVWLAFAFFRGPAPAANPVVSTSAPQTEATTPINALRKLEGDAARTYLEQTSEGQSLMKSLEAERFGLKRQQRAPFKDVRGDGYLGLSHDENLNAWFDEEGATIRPTVSEKERDGAWRLGLRLKAYGYGAVLREARAASSQTVKGNRIEYERGAGDAGASVVEWYVNKSEGIEQGFTLSEPPARREGVAVDEPLRLVVAVTGDLRARAAQDGQAVELNKGGAGVLSYSHLVASDASGQKLAARMETNAAGDEIALIVDDAGARYPVVVDPITATLEQKLDTDTFRQAEARFGFALAIDRDNAVIGAWREDDDPANPDGGAAYIFTRSGSSWTRGRRFPGFSGWGCGSSVDISGSHVAFGCPGAGLGKGRAYFFDVGSSAFSEIDPATFGSTASIGRYGESIAIGGNWIVVGAPLSNAGGTDSGTAYIYKISGNTITPRIAYVGGNGSQMGAAVAVDDNTVVMGAPDAGKGSALAVDMVTLSDAELLAGDGVNDDGFGNSVAVSGNTVVVGARLDDNERGVDAGAAYVFVRGGNGLWTQQQKLTASDGHAGDFFSEHAVAIEGNTIVVGAYSNGNPLGDNSGNDDDRGAAYVFTRSGTVWTQQTKISQTNFAGGEPGAHFGIDVDLSGTTVLIGARGASAGSVVRAGAAFVYRLNCLPPASSYTTFDPFIFSNNRTVCPGGSTIIFARHSGTQDNTSYQWRRNGVNIPGATGFEYTINNVGAGDAGSYDVIISNACGSEISEPATLSVHSFTLNPTSQNFSASGSNGIVNVTSTGSSCGWTATSNASWINITSGASGTGNGTVGFTVAANAGAQRTGTITIAGQTFSVTQDGINCSYAIAPTSQNFNASGGANSVGVTATAGCAWTAVSNAPSFITITAGASGTGNGAVSYSVAANPDSTQRSGTITIAGQTFTVTQDGLSCSYSINPTSLTFNASGSSASTVSVTATAGCPWTAVSNNTSFITVTGGASGTGNGTVTYSVAANTGAQRTGTMTIAGQTFTVTQNAVASSPPTMQLAQSTYNVTESTGSIAILVNRAGDLSAAMSVNYSTSDNSNFLQNCNVINGRATSRCDYISLVGTLHFAAGENSKTLFLPIVDDTYLEGAETFFLSLSHPTGGGVIGVNQQATITLTDNGNDGIGLPNPIDDATFFVRQHYMDFLGREPDPSATAWVTQINQCAPADQSCRLSVSQGIYNSPEFKDRGYFIYKFYAVALGRKPSYDEFVLDRARVSGFQSDAELEQSKQDFIADFMSRPEFGGYNGLTNDQYVQTLFNVSGITQVTVNGVVRTVSAMQQQLNGGSRSRGQILRDIAESPEVSARFLIESTIVMHYFGYLRRDPDAAYQDWINIYNQTGDSRNVTNGFVNSLEYRNRFGP